MDDVIDYSDKQGCKKMAEQEHKDFLLETAKKVSIWIIDEVKMKRFQEQDKAFYDDYQEWESENWDYDQRIQFRTNETKEAREKRISKIPQPRPCPLDLLTIADHHTDPHILHLVEEGVPLEGHEQEFSSEQILNADYVFLTVLHDKVLKDTRHFNPINTDIWLQDEVWAEHLWQRMTEERSGWKPEFLLGELNDALKKVEADLATMSAETEYSLFSELAKEISDWASSLKISKNTTDVPFNTLDFKFIVVQEKLDKLLVRLEAKGQSALAVRLERKYTELIEITKYFDNLCGKPIQSIEAGEVETAPQEVQYVAHCFVDLLDDIACQMQQQTKAQKKHLTETEPGPDPEQEKEKAKTSLLTWLKNHPHSYSLQASVACLIICLAIGLFKPQLRNWFWGAAALSFFVLILSLLGGPKKDE